MFTNSESIWRGRMFLLAALFAFSASQATAYERSATVDGLDLFSYDFSVLSAGEFTLTFTEFDVGNALSRGGVTLTSAAGDVAQIEFDRSASLAPLGSSRSGLSRSSGRQSSLFSSRYGLSSRGVSAQDVGSGQGSVFQQSISGSIEAGTYTLIMYGFSGPSSAFSFGAGLGEYSVTLAGLDTGPAPVPLPASVVFLASGLAIFRYIARKKKV